MFLIKVSKCFVIMARDATCKSSKSFEKLLSLEVERYQRREAHRTLYCCFFIMLNLA